MFKTRFISILALLMTAVTGAWAQEQSETIVTRAAGWADGGLIVEGTHFTISNGGDYADSDGMFAAYGITVTPKNGETITKVVISCTSYPSSVNDGNTSVSSGTKEITNGGGTITVTGVNASTFTFTCSNSDPQFSQFVVYYTPATVAVTGVTLAPTSATLTVGKTVTLTATISPSNATNKTVTWSSSNTSVATVSNGVVTAVGAGTATITATATNGTAATSDDKTATCTVTVTVPVSGVTLAPTSATLIVGETTTLTPTVAPATATDKTVTWTTSDDAVATVSNGVVTAVGAGIATITVTATNGTVNTSDDKTATCTVTVSYPTYNLTANEETGDLSGLNDYKGKICTVNYTRSFTEGKTSTVCLPFAYTKKAGDGSFYAFTNIEKSGSEYVATMTEPASTTLTANTPYLYMPNKDGEVDFSGAYTIPDNLTAGSTTSNGWTFKGNYEDKTWDPAPTGIYGFSAANYDEVSQGQFVKVGTNVTIQPMRCYLKYKDGSEDYAGARGMKRAEQLPETIKVRLVSASGEVTAIGSLQTKTGEVTLDGDAWYSLDGRRLEGKPATKGVYINNNNKVIIK